MRLRFALLILFLSSSGAFAQPQNVIQGSTSSSVPVPTGSQHSCGEQWYPPAALAAGEQGTTTLSFRVGANGVPKNILVATGSGFADLDDAAAKCVGTWRYHPAMAGGNPIEADWKASVQWSMPAGKTVYVTVSPGRKAPHVIAEHQQLIGSQVCPNTMKPPAPLGKVSEVMFWVLADGSISHLKLIGSSGDEKLNDMALTCASQWHYTPLTGGSARHVSVMFVAIPW